MRSCTELVAVLIVSAMASLDAIAVELRPGVQYTGETTLESPEYGASLVLPAGWVGALPQDSEVLIMQSQTFEAYIFAGIDEMTVAEARSTMSRAIDVGEGVVLHPESEVRLEGSVLTAEYSVSGSQHPLIGHVTTVVGKYGWGVSFIAASAPQNASNLRSAVSQLTRSLSLVEPRSAAAASPSKSSGPWAEELSGRKLSHFFTRTGYTEEDYIWLCPNGRFFKSFNSGGFGGGASGAFESENAGFWNVSGDLDGGTLLLTYNDGSTARYSLTHEGTKLFLDGKRYFREPTNCN